MHNPWKIVELVVWPKKRTSDSGLFGLSMCYQPIAHSWLCLELSQIYQDLSCWAGDHLPWRCLSAEKLTLLPTQNPTRASGIWRAYGHFTWWKPGTKSIDPSRKCDWSTLASFGHAYDVGIGGTSAPRASNMVSSTYLVSRPNTPVFLLNTSTNNVQYRKVVSSTGYIHYRLIDVSRDKSFHLCVHLL